MQSKYGKSKDPLTLNGKVGSNRQPEVFVSYQNDTCSNCMVELWTQFLTLIG